MSILHLFEKKLCWQCALLVALIVFALNMWIALGNIFLTLKDPMKPLVTSNCTMYDVTPVIQTNYTATYGFHNDTELFEAPTHISIDVARDRDWFPVYQISYIWYLPFGVTLGTLLVFLLSLFSGTFQHITQIKSPVCRLLS